MNNEQKAREAFEKWAVRNDYPIEPSGFDGQPYASAGTSCALEGYLAATTRESELLAVIRAMDGALRYVEAHYDGMEKADIVGKAIRLAEQVV